jgi:DNA polymerase-3 subunit delta'
MLARLAITAAQNEGNDAAPSEESAMLRRLGRRAPAARWAALRGEIEESFARTDALNLDRKQTILGAFFAIERAAG